MSQAISPIPPLHDVLAEKTVHDVLALISKALSGLKHSAATVRLRVWRLAPTTNTRRTRRFEQMENQAQESLTDVDSEFRRLQEQHRDHEERLQVLATKVRLSEDEELEEKRLKKEKLLLKDRMEALSRHRREGVSH